MKILSLVPTTALLRLASAGQSLEVDSSSLSSIIASATSLSYITGAISYAINTNTLVIDYSTDSNSRIINASATTVSKSKNNAGVINNNNGIAAAGGLLAGIFLM